MENLVQNLNSITEFLVNCMSIVFVAFLLWNSVYIKTKELRIIVAVCLLVFFGLFVFRAEIEHPNVRFWMSLAILSSMVIGMLILWRKIAKNKKQ